MIKKPVYLDYHSTTPVDPQVLKLMIKYFTEDYGNPGSRTHEYGIRAEQAVEKARGEISKYINAQSSKEIIFLSGATEANNLVLFGIATKFGAEGKNHIITSSIEHKSILDTTEELKKRGMTVTYLNPNNEGLINLDELERSITPKTCLISIMHANNEIGVLNPIEEIGRIAQKNTIFFHCDASQSLGKVAIDVQKAGISLLSLSAHKIYGPKGIGALYVRQKNPRVVLNPIIYGGGQERGLRSGTLAAPLIVAFGEAVKMACTSMNKETEKLRKLRDYFLAGLRKHHKDLLVNGTMASRLPNNLNISFRGIDSEALMLLLREDLALSNGSACTSTTWKSSYVLEAMGYDEERCKGALRLSVGRYTSKEEIDFAIERIAKTVSRLRELSPIQKSLSLVR